MKLPLNIVRKHLTSFIWVLFLLSGGFFYIWERSQKLDKQEINTNKIYETAKLEKINFEKREKEYIERIRNLESKIEQQARDKELSKLTLRYIDEFAGVDTNISCGNDLEHNERSKKAFALLSLIEAKAIEYGRRDVIEKFVKPNKPVVQIWEANCKKNKH